jgi:hypothetical protein
MLTVKPARARHSADYFGNQLRIIIPSHKKWFQQLFLVFWFSSWTFGELIVLHSLLQGELRGHLFNLIWLILWTVGGLVAFLTIFWILLGQEIIIIDGLSLVHQRQIMGMGQTRLYALDDVRRLRTTTTSIAPSRQWPGCDNGVVAFDHGTHTVRLGHGIDEAEGKQIIAAIMRYVPLPLG